MWPRQDEQRVARRPVIENESWRICTLPDLGELNGPHRKRIHVVDHGIIRAADGTWQLWACMRGTGVGRLLFGWEGDALESGPWRERGVVARADPAYGESKRGDVETIGAPFFLRDADTYYCFYHSGTIRMMTSRDGVNYERTPKADGSYELYPQGGRDVMVLKLDETYFFYSTVSIGGGNGPAYSFVTLRTTRDLQTFSDYTKVAEAGMAGYGPVSAESPFVVHLDGYFYLFRSSSMDFHTYVYRSTTPYCFGCGDDSGLIARFPIKAPELLEVDGQWFISDLADFHGIRLSRLQWEAAE